MRGKERGVSFEIVHYSIHSVKIGKNIRFLLLSDLHNGQHGFHNADIVEAVSLEKPDLILCAGDMVIARTDETEEAVRLLSSLQKIAPVAMADGNHESKLYIHHHDEYEGIMESLVNEGVTFLHNSSSLFEIRGETVEGHGLEIPMEYYKKLTIPHFPQKEMVNLLDGRPDPRHFSFLIAHNPQFMPQYLRWGADLTVSGHFHGGVMRLTDHQVLISPYGMPLPRFGYGEYRWHGRVGIVTSGLGDHAVPFRFHNPMEIAVIDVLAEGREEAWHWK